MWLAMWHVVSKRHHGFLSPAIIASNVNKNRNEQWPRQEHVATLRRAKTLEVRMDQLDVKNTAKKC